MSSPNDLLYLFERPTEPVFMPKGDKKAVFDVPPEYITERYRPLQNDLATRFGGGDTIKVKKIRLPDLSLPLKLGRRDSFSLFLPLHRKMAARLITVFLGMRNLEDFISATVYCRDRMNPFLFNYALSVAMLHRPDTKNVQIPPVSEIFPEKFMDGTLFARAKEESNIVQTDDSRIPLVLNKDYSASDLDEEHRVAYFREDVGINLHHWHWHLVYPFDGPLEVVNKDRRGELFYYMHQQILARYNFERFSNNLSRVTRFLNWRDPIKEGYFSKLDSLIASRSWPPRHSQAILSDINREVDQISFDLSDLERWRDRIFAAISTRRVVNMNGDAITLTEMEGIDVLGNILEASILSPNRALYGDLHNLGHVAISLSHDPDHRHLETFSVMGDSGTAMRDPIFYRWHAFINDIFEKFKAIIPRYPINQLDFEGVRIVSADIEVEGGRRNQLMTFWQQSDVNLSRGMDFQPRGDIFARFTHLQHAPFTYNIMVESTKGGPRMGTVRIFLAPQFDERGLPMLFNDQRKLFIELDKFVVNLKGGKQQIKRKSVESSVTIPFERTFRNLDRGRPQEGQELDEFNFCGCGWPQHMLIPKGSAAGLPCQLFVMVSDYEGDKVDGGANVKICADAASYCGLKDSKYPDRRSMGYPFDRVPRDGVDTLTQFLTPNMGVQNVTITFSNRTVAPIS